MVRDGHSERVGRDEAGDARLREARKRADRYLTELVEEVGEPSPEDVAEAEAWATRIDQALKKARPAQ